MFLIIKLRTYAKLNCLKYHSLFEKKMYSALNNLQRYYLPTPPLGQDMTQGQFLSGV